MRQNVVSLSKPVATPRPSIFAQTAYQIYEAVHGRKPATWGEANSHVNGGCMACAKAKQSPAR